MTKFTPLTRDEDRAYKRYRTAFEDRALRMISAPAYVTEQLAPVRLRLERAIEDAYRVRDDVWYAMRDRAAETYAARRTAMTANNELAAAAARLNWVAARAQLREALNGYAESDRLVRRRLRDFAAHLDGLGLSSRRVWNALIRPSARLILQTRQAQWALRKRARWTIVERHRHARLEAAILRERTRLAIYLAVAGCRFGRAPTAIERAAE